MRSLTRTLALVIAVLAGLSAAGCGDDNSTNPPGRNPTTFDIPTEMTLEEAVANAIPGDTLSILFSPLATADVVTIQSKQTPLLITGSKTRPRLTTTGIDAILRFNSPNPGTEIREVGFGGGNPAVEILGEGSILIDQCDFLGGVVQVYGAGSGLQATVTGCLMREAGLFSIEVGSGAVLTATGNTIDGAGDCGIILEGSAAGTVANNIIWRSSNYGLACTGSQDLAEASGCNDIHQSGLGHYLGCTEPDSDFHLDPEFCDADGGNYTLFDISPCTPINSGGCGLIGAREPGCELP
jgi:parallel beta-helix repeat protein